MITPPITLEYTITCWQCYRQCTKYRQITHSACRAKWWRPTGSVGFPPTRVLVAKILHSCGLLTDIKNPPVGDATGVYIPSAGYYPHGGNAPTGGLPLATHYVMLVFTHIWSACTFYLTVPHILGKRLTGGIDTLSGDLISLPVSHPANNVYSPHKQKQNLL
jgi:hypothetical protein